MRLAGIMLVLALGAATAADADSPPGGGFPDIARTYFHRANCHEAYDLAIEEAHAGRLSDADGDWAESYEAAAKAKQPCPAPGEALAGRATDRVISTDEGLGYAALYGDAGDAAAYFEVANSVFQAKTTKVTPPQAWQLLVESANRGYAQAKYFEALLYIKGTATGKPDYADALPLLEAAAKSGHVDALFLAGNYYYDGSLGVKKDSARAFTYFTQAAERGHVYATYMAANMANDGNGVKTDHELAYRLARNLADQGEMVGSIIAASALLQMKDAKDHQDEVLYWMDRASREGDDKMRGIMSEMRPKVVAAFNRANAPPEYQPRAWKACPMKTTCLVDTVSGRQECTTNKDYWNDCDG
jgi:TPR repeat protein